VYSHLIFSMTPPQPRPTLFPYTTLFRSLAHPGGGTMRIEKISAVTLIVTNMRESVRFYEDVLGMEIVYGGEASGFSSLRAKEMRSEEHTSELQSRRDLVCRLLLEKKKYR